MKNQLLKALSLTLLIIVSSVVYHFAQFYYEQNLNLSARLNANQELLLHGEYLSQSMAERMSILTVVDESIKSYYDSPDMRSIVLRIIQALYSEKSGLRVIQVFPDSGQTMIYPYTNNEAVSQRTLSDLLNDDRLEVREDVRRAIETGAIALSGPYELRQGGLGMVARKPIFIEEQFWGLAVLVFDIPPLLEIAGLEPSHDTYSYSLNDNNGAFAGEGLEFDSPLEYTINLPDREWTLLMEPRDGWASLYRSNLLVFRIILLLFLVTINILIYSFMTQQNRLKIQVKERTLSLEESNTRFRESILHAPVPMVLVKQNSEIMILNESFTNSFGYTPNDIPTVEQWWPLAFADSRYRRLIKRNWTKVINKSEKDKIYSTKEFFIKIQTKDKSRRQIEVKMTVIGEISIYALKDLTERINAERQRKELQEQLSHKNKMDSLGVLAGGIAHDINNLLGAIMNSVELMTKEDIPTETKENYSRIIVESCERGAELTGKLLAFGRRKKLQLVEINLHRIIDDIGVILKRTTGKKINIEMQLHAEKHHIEGDIAAVQNAIMNLCINGFHSMDKGGTLTIKTSNTIVEGNEPHASYFKIEPGSFCEINIEDQGTGIAPENIIKIFEPFFTTKSHGKGSGLGLAAVYGTAVAHHGFVKVDSTPGEGSCFTLGLPIKTDS